jgi:dTDP-4-dehydrorhamnose reductase
VILTLTMTKYFKKQGSGPVKILVTGSNGQLGTDSVAVLGTTHDVTALKRSDLNITDPAAVEQVVKALRPAVVLNCAAFTRVDDCEEQRSLAFAVNVTGPKNLARCVQRYGGKLIQISTDYVFDGRREVPNPYVEEDEPAPVSYYGQSKLEGERVIQEETDRCVIVRTAWVYGIAGRNFPKTILRLALKGPQKEIRVVNDQFGSPTWSFRLARQIERLIEVDGHGIYHATAEGYGTWYEAAAAFLQRMRVAHNLSPCTSEQYPTRAIRPRNSIMENQRLKEAGINCMCHWEEDLEQFVTLFRDRLIREALEE